MESNLAYSTYRNYKWVLCPITNLPCQQARLTFPSPRRCMGLGEFKLGALKALAAISYDKIKFFSWTAFFSLDGRQFSMAYRGLGIAKKEKA